MRAHCDIGAKILAQANDERFVLAERVALSHHERWDGSGYPNNLAGEAIPLAARIVAIADAFDVLVQGRAYKAAIPVEAALAVIERAAGFHFDPGLVSLFVPMIQRLWELHGNGLNDFLCETGAQSSFLDARNSMNVLLSQL